MNEFMTTTLYGINQCDTIKKAKKWLQSHDEAFTFHDFRKDGIDEAWLSRAEAELGWEQLLNKRGTTFRQLPDEQKSGLTREKALELMLAQPAMIKRPVLHHNQEFFLGFTDSQYSGIFYHE